MNAVEARQPRPTPSQAVSDALVMLRRDLVVTIRRPALLVVSFLQPVLLALLFRYVFGGAIEVSGIDYVDYLMPGLLVQTAIFGALVTGIGIAEDLQHGAADRFRSLPMARSAILIGRTLSDLVRNTASLAVLVGVGVAVGFRPEGSPTQLLAGLALVLAFSYVISWVAAAIGLWMRDPETVHSAGFIWALPLTFLSSAFVPTETMPAFLQAVAEANPVTPVVDSTRTLATDRAQSGPFLWPLCSLAALAAIFVPLAINRFAALSR